jgi:hypothetical protein
VEHDLKEDEYEA